MARILLWPLGRIGRVDQQPRSRLTLESINPCLQNWELGTHHLLIDTHENGCSPNLMLCALKCFHTVLGSVVTHTHIPSLPSLSLLCSGCLAPSPQYNFRKLTLRALHLPLRINRKQERVRRETHLEFNRNVHFPITSLWTMLFLPPLLQQCFRTNPPGLHRGRDPLVQVLEWDLEAFYYYTPHNSNSVLCLSL